MFLEKIYNEKVNQEEQQNNKTRSQTMNVNKINFDKDERVFFNENIPKKALEAHKYIQDYIDPDILQLKKQQWNCSNSGKVYDESLDRQLMKMRLGHQLYLPQINIDNKTIKKINYNNSTLNNQSNVSGVWNQSVEIDKKDINNRFNNLTIFSTQGTKYKNFNLIKFEEKNKLNLVQRQTNLNDQIRQQKKEEMDIREHLKKQFLHQNPNSSVEKVNSVVFKIVENHRHQLKYQEVSSPLSYQPFKFQEEMQDYPFKPQLGTSVKKNIKFNYHHNGIWKEFVKQYENKEKKVYCAWSCCMKMVQESQGCVKTIIDQNKWIQ